MFRVGVAALAVCLVSGCAMRSTDSSSCAPMAEFAYQDFGPQSMAVDFIGYEIWQWQAQSGGDPSVEYPIGVIVFSKGQDVQAKAKFPVNADAQQDFRYVSYDSTVTYLNKNIKELADLEKEGMPFGDLKTTLENTKTRVEKEVCSK